MPSYQPTTLMVINKYHATSVLQWQNINHCKLTCTMVPILCLQSYVYSEFFLHLIPIFIPHLVTVLPNPCSTKQGMWVFLLPQVGTQCPTLLEPYVLCWMEYWVNPHSTSLILHLYCFISSLVYLMTLRIVVNAGLAETVYLKAPKIGYSVPDV